MPGDTYSNYILEKLLRTERKLLHSKKKYTTAPSQFNLWACKQSKHDFDMYAKILQVYNRTQKVKMLASIKLLKLSYKI